MIAVLGQPGARIPSTALTEGRIAEITGIVRPAYPSASDKRPSILPRSAADVRQSGSPAPASRDGDAAAVDSAARPSAALATGLQQPPGIDADLADLDSLIGETVRVGGLVVDLRPDGFTLDDGTATARIVVGGEASSLVDLVEPSDAVNVTGRVERRPDDELAVVVDDPAAVVLASSVDGGAATDPAPSPSPAPSAAPDDVRTAATVDPAVLPGAGAGVATMLVIALVSVGMSMLRRRQGRRLLAARVATRLAAVAGLPAGTPDGEAGTKRVPSVE